MRSDIESGPVAIINHPFKDPVTQEQMDDPVIIVNDNYFPIPIIYDRTTVLTVVERGYLERFGINRENVRNHLMSVQSLASIINYMSNNEEKIIQFRNKEELEEKLDDLYSDPMSLEFPFEEDQETVLLLVDGHSYKRNEIEQWINQAGNSPCNKQVVSNRFLQFISDPVIMHLMSKINELKPNAENDCEFDLNLIFQNWQQREPIPKSINALDDNKSALWYSLIWTLFVDNQGVQSTLITNLLSVFATINHFRINKFIAQKYLWDNKGKKLKNNLLLSIYILIGLSLGLISRLNILQLPGFGIFYGALSRLSLQAYVNFPLVKNYVALPRKTVLNDNGERGQIFNGKVLFIEAMFAISTFYSSGKMLQLAINASESSSNEEIITESEKLILISVVAIHNLVNRLVPITSAAETIGNMSKNDCFDYIKQPEKIKNGLLELLPSVALGLLTYIVAGDPLLAITATVTSCLDGTMPKIAKCLYTQFYPFKITPEMVRLDHENFAQGMDIPVDIRSDPEKRIDFVV